MADPTPTATDTKPRKDEPKFRWITNNEDGVKILALRPLPQPGSSTLAAPGQIILPPGATVIDRALWEQWKEENADKDGNEGEATRLLKGKIPSDPHRLRRAERAGQVFIVEGPIVRDRLSPLSGLSPDEARGMIAEVRDERILRQLKAVERREQILVAIEAAIKEFERGMRSPTVS